MTGLSAPDSLATEYEISEFIASLVRLVKPKVVVETGCYLGYTSRAILTALEKNGDGTLYTCDSDAERAKEFGAQNITGEELIALLPDGSVDIAFLDSGGDLARFREAKALIPKLAPIAWVLLHDSLNGQDKCHANISAVCNWPSVVFPYGRGLTLFCVGQSIAQDKIPR